MGDLKNMKMITKIKIEPIKCILLRNGLKFENMDFRHYMKYSLKEQSDKDNRKNFKNSRNKICRLLQSGIVCLFILQSLKSSWFQFLSKTSVFVLDDRVANGSK